MTGSASFSQPAEALPFVTMLQSWALNLPIEPEAFGNLLNVNRAPIGWSH